MQILTRHNEVIDYCSDGYVCTGCTVVCESKSKTFMDCTVVTVDSVPFDIDTYDYCYIGGQFVRCNEKDNGSVIVDDVTGIQYKWGCDNGALYIVEV